MIEDDWDSDKETGSYWNLQIQMLFVQKFGPSKLKSNKNVVLLTLKLDPTYSKVEPFEYKVCITRHALWQSAGPAETLQITWSWQTRWSNAKVRDSEGTLEGLWRDTLLAYSNENKRLESRRILSRSFWIRKFGTFLQSFWDLFDSNVSRSLLRSFQKRLTSATDSGEIQTRWTF